MLITFLYLNNIYYNICPKSKRAHLESLCCLQCISRTEKILSHVTIEQNIDKEIEVNRNGWTRK